MVLLNAEDHSLQTIAAGTMRLSDRGELSLLGQIRERFGKRSGDVIAGVGDDAAVIAPLSRNMLLTTDMMAEGVHFDLRLTTWFQLGYKIVSVNVSDIYAMGGSPRYLLLDLSAPARTKDKDIGSFFDGLHEASKYYRLKLIGGDLSSSLTGLVIAATVLGYAERPVMRSGARPGDGIYVTGCLGDAACGLLLLKRLRRRIAFESGERVDKPLAWSTMKPLIMRHLMPEARDSGRIARYATAMIDVSDGLCIDLSRLCDESRVGARLFMRDVPVSNSLKRAARYLKVDPYTLSTTGGEDYELLFTAPKQRRIDAFCIGEITEKERVAVDLDGAVKPLPAGGYEHWR